MQCTVDLFSVYFIGIKNYRTFPDSDEKPRYHGRLQATTGSPLPLPARSEMLLLIATLIFGF